MHQLSNGGEMRVVFLSSCNLQDFFVIDAVARTMPIHALVRIKWETCPGHQTHRSCLQKARAFLPDRLERFYREQRFKLLRWSLRQRLGSPPRLPPVEKYIEMPSWMLNKEEGRTRIAELGADLMIVSSAPILRPEIFTLPKVAALNIHYGIAPRYRGEHTLFWPLLKGDFEHIGVTIHYIARKVDAGAIIAHGFPALARKDGEADVLAKSVRLTGKMLCEVLEVFKKQHVQGKNKDGEGTLFRAADRKMLHDLRYFLLRISGLRRLPETDERIERHY